MSLKKLHQVPAKAANLLLAELVYRQQREA